MALRIQLTNEARRDLKEIWAYQYETSKNRQVADRTLSKIREEIRNLRDSITLGHHRPDLTDLDLHFLGVFSFLIVFRRLETSLQIVGVIHAARDMPQILDDRLP